MSKVQILRALVKQRLTAAAEDIFGLFERTIAEYEETLCRSKEENERQRRLLDAVFNPQLRLHRAGCSADVQQLLESKDEVLQEQQEWGPSVEQEDPEPPHIKEEQEEVWTSQEGEQLHGLEEADITKFTFTPVPVKSEDDDDDDEEKPQSSQLHQIRTEQMETDADGEDCGGAEPARNSHPDTHLAPETEDKTGDCPEPETEVSDGDQEENREPQSSQLHQRQADGEDCGGQTEVGAVAGICCFLPPECRLVGCPDTEDKTGVSSETDVSDGDWEETRDPLSSLNSQINNDVSVSDEGCKTDRKPFSCSVCGRRFSQKMNMLTHMRTHTEEREAKGKPFSCSLCDKVFKRRSHFMEHMRCHTGGKPFTCSICHKAFRLKAFLINHMNIHTGEKPFGCSVCGRRFSQKVNMLTHTRTHTEERFTQQGNLTAHMRLNTEDSVDCKIHQRVTERRSSSSSLTSCEKLSPAWSTPATAANHLHPPTVLYDVFKYGINTGPALQPDDGLWTFLQNRDVPEDNMQNMQQDRIGISLIGEIDETTMAAYIPGYGDGIGIRAESGDDPKRLSLFEKLRRKMETKSNHKDPDSEEEELCLKPIRTHLINNKRALKMTRRIELGWIHDKKQVRKRSGGGTRLVDISKKATKTEILSVAKTIFFPNETSSKGRWEEFSHDIVDFQEAYLDEGVTVGELYETHVRKLRFYLFTERLTSEAFTEEDGTRSHDQHKHTTQVDEQLTHKTQDSQCWEFFYRSSHTACP